MRLISMADANNTPVTPHGVPQLPNDVATLHRMILELNESLRQRDHAYQTLQLQIDRLLRRLYGPRNERFDPSQLLLFVEALSAADAASASPTPPEADRAQVADQPKRRCRPHGRRRLPDSLPREVRHHELPQAARLCADCGQCRLDIGVDTSERLEYRPASLRVIEHRVHKYVCPGCRRDGDEAATVERATNANPEPECSNLSPATPDQPADASAKPTPCVPVIVTAPRPASPIPKCMAGPGLLAHLIVSKYDDHLPLYRLERIYERQGVFLPRSTLCDWLLACGNLLRPLYDAMVRVVLQSQALHTDDTTVKHRDPKTQQVRTARMWAYLGDAAHPYNVFDFTLTRRRDGPVSFLANYRGYLHADAFSGYDGLYLPDPVTATARIVEVACNAHARRKFYEARTSDALRSHQALAYYRQLYELEASAQRNGFDATQRHSLRQDLSLRIWEKFRAWLESQRGEVLPKSPLGEALGYALRNWTALVRYTEAGHLSIDNNVAEREMKRIAIGRKNWLFVGSSRGGATAALLMSFTSSCRRLGVEPWSYLEDVLTRLPTTSGDGLLDLLPDRWQASRVASSPASPPPDLA
jgi:transposase